MTDAWAKFWLAMAVTALAAAIGGLAAWPGPTGSLAEWAAAIGTTLGVMAAVWTVHRGERERRAVAEAERQRLLELALHEAQMIEAFASVLARIVREQRPEEIQDHMIDYTLNAARAFPVHHLSPAAAHEFRKLQFEVEGMMFFARHLAKLRQNQAPHEDLVAQADRRVANTAKFRRAIEALAAGLAAPREVAEEAPESGT